MKKEYLVCDKCGNTDLDKHHIESIHWAIERRTDAAGGMETIETNYDLCVLCLRRLARNLCDRANPRFPGIVLDQYVSGESLDDV